MEHAGDYTYSAVPYNDFGQSHPVTATIYVGAGIPSAVESVKVTETSVPGQVKVTWTPVTTNVDGGTISPEYISYDVYLYDRGRTDCIGTGVKNTELVYYAVKSGQDFVQVAVYPVTETGEGEGGLSKLAAVGEPYVGFAESFADGSMSHIFGVTTIPGTEGAATWTIKDDSSISGVTASDNDNGYVGMSAQYYGYGARLYTGKISLAEILNPVLTFSTYSVVGDDGLDINEISVVARVAGETEWETVMERTPVSEFTSAQGWTRISVNLLKYAGKTVQLGIDGIIKRYAYVLVDDIRFESLADNDLQASSIIVPSHVNAGSDYNVKVNVVNVGAKATSAYTVELYADGQKVDEAEGKNIAFGGTATFRGCLKTIVN